MCVLLTHACVEYTDILSCFCSTHHSPSHPEAVFHIYIVRALHLVVLVLPKICTYYSKETGTGLAVVALWLLDLAMNASLVAIRAVVADCAPPSQQVMRVLGPLAEYLCIISAALKINIICVKSRVCFTSALRRTKTDARPKKTLEARFRTIADGSAGNAVWSPFYLNCAAGNARLLARMAAMRGDPFVRALHPCM